MCKIPFIVVKYHPDKTAPWFPDPGLFQEKQVKVQSTRPMQCFGDSTILSKMRLQELSADETIEDVLGLFGRHIPEAFQRIDKAIEHF